MTGFALDKNGDIIISNGDIQMAHGAELTRSKIQTILGTKIGEWFFNRTEGTAHGEILNHRWGTPVGVGEEDVKSVILDALLQVDKTFLIKSCQCEFNKSERKLSVSFKATAKSGETVDMTVELG